MSSPAQPIEHRLASLLSSFPLFASHGAGVLLRPYQREIADAVLHSVLNNLGLTFVFLLPRQSGKNELQALLQAYLLLLYSHLDREIVSVSPTFKPQTLNAMNRLQSRLESNPLTRGCWHRHHGASISLGSARIHFYSGSPRAQTVGATASLLLNIDEAQDVLPSIYDRRFAPMLASANATRLFWGTAWTASTLLAREHRLALHRQEQDGLRRVWHLTAEQVALAHPPYGHFVRSEVARLGRDHPFIRTQYFSEQIDSQLSMFNPTRLALIHSDSLSIVGATYMSPDSSRPCAFLLDVAGQDEACLSAPSGDADPSLQNPGRDSTTLSIVSIDFSTLETLRAPAYTVVHRQQWLGLSHLAIFGQLKNLAQAWHPLHIVIDATGVGEGLWALLDKAFPGRLIPVKFSQQEKSELGWRFLAIIETGRFRDAALSDAVRLQYQNCRSEVLPGPSRTLRWGVPEGARGPDGALIHDDYLLADSLVARLDLLT